MYGAFVLQGGVAVERYVVQGQNILRIAQKSYGLHCAALEHEGYLVGDGLHFVAVLWIGPQLYINRYAVVSSYVD